MGKCVRIRGSKPPSPGEAAAYLTLRSGRRVPVAAAAACSPPARRRSSRGSTCRGCGATAAAKRACGSPGRRKSAELPRPALNGGARPEEELPTPPQASPVAPDAVDGNGGDSSGPNAPLSGDGVVQLKREHESKAGVAGQPSPPLEAEMEAFFAAAELAERRRFAETYNYDVALDRPLEGQFEWTLVST